MNESFELAGKHLGIQVCTLASNLHYSNTVKHFVPCCCLHHEWHASYLGSSVFIPSCDMRMFWATCKAHLALLGLNKSGATAIAITKLGRS